MVAIEVVVPLARLEFATKHCSSHDRIYELEDIEERGYLIKQMAILPKENQNIRQSTYKTSNPMCGYLNSKSRWACLESLSALKVYS